MHKFEFAEDDLFVNRLKTYPEYNIFIYQSRQYTNKEKNTSGSNGGLIVYDINRNTLAATPRISASHGFSQDFRKNLSNPIVNSFSQNLALASANTNLDGYYTSKLFGLGQVQSVTSSYSYSVPITRRLTSKVDTELVTAFDIPSGSNINATIALSVNPTASALQNIARKYSVLSPHFIFEGCGTAGTSSLFFRDSMESNGVYISHDGSTVPNRNLLTSNINFIFIPQMYYGSSIKKGSVNLKFRITGSKIAECSDKNENGELIEVTGSSTGSVVGLVMYDEGIIMLTASYDFNVGTPDNIGIMYDGESTPIRSSWLYYGTTLNDYIKHTTLSASSYDLNFKGTNYVTSMTMFAHADKGQINHSNNPTYRVLSKQLVAQTGSGNIFAQGSTSIKNVVTASHTSASFEKTTYISKINIYDENSNLIAVTSLANPVKKTEARDYTFKLKLDI